jgi:hypothetical protein
VKGQRKTIVASYFWKPVPIPGRTERALSLLFYGYIFFCLEGPAVEGGGPFGSALEAAELFSWCFPRQSSVEDSFSPCRFTVGRTAVAKAHALTVGVDSDLLPFAELSLENL